MAFIIAIALGFIGLCFIVAIVVAMVAAITQGLYKLGAALVRVFLGLCLASGAGLATAAILGSDPASRTNIALAVGLLLFPPIIWAIYRLGALADRAVAAKPVPIKQPPGPTPKAISAVPTTSNRWKRAGWFGADPVAPEPGVAAWALLAEAAGDSSARIGVARRSCERLLAAASIDPTLHDPDELVRVIRKHVPAAIESSLRDAKNASDQDRRALIEDLLDTLEDIAAAAERLVAHRAIATNRDVALLRRRLDNMTTKGPL